MKGYLDQGVAEIVPGVVFIDKVSLEDEAVVPGAGRVINSLVHMLDIECFTSSTFCSNLLWRRPSLCIGPRSRSRKLQASSQSSCHHSPKARCRHSYSILHVVNVISADGVFDHRPYSEKALRKMIKRKAKAE